MTENTCNHSGANHAIRQIQKSLHLGSFSAMAAMIGIFSLILAYPHANASSESSLEIIADLPEISISADKTTWTEGEVLSFTISSTAAPEESLSINVNVSETEEFLRGILPQTVTLDADRTEAHLLLQTDDDRVDEFDGAATVKVESGTGYEVSQSAGKASANVLDNDTAVISISPVSTVANKYYRARFRVDSSIKSKRDLEIRFYVYNENFNGVPNLRATTKIMRAGHTSLHFDMIVYSSNIHMNDPDHPNGYVKLSLVQNLLNSDHYRLDPNASSAVIPMAEGEIETGTSEELPKLTIRRNMVRKVYESDRHIRYFVESLNVLPQQDLHVNLEITESGGTFLSENPQDHFVLRKGYWKNYFSVWVEDDEVDEPHGWVTVRILPGEGYEISDSPKDRFSAKVFDDDGDDTTQIGIESLRNSVNEGQNAIFQLLVTHSHESPHHLTNLSVNLNVEETGDFLRSTAPESVRVNPKPSWSRNDQLISTFSLPTLDDSAEEEDGEIEVSILPGNRYNIDSVKSSASVRILDNDSSGDPVISISQVPVLQSLMPIIEGETVKYFLYSTSSKASGFDVSVEVNQDGDFLADSSQLRIVSFAPNRNSSFLELNTSDDDKDEQDGIVRLSILSGEGYSVATEPDGSASFDIQDNDVPVVEITNALSTSEITEGEDAIFQISSDIAPWENLTVNVSVSQSGDFFSQSGPSSVELAAETLNTRLTVGTLDDGSFEADGSVAVRILTGEGYSNSSSEVAISVLDNDVKPVISLAASTASVAEGGRKEFTVSAASAVSSQLSVYLFIRKALNQNETVTEHVAVIPSDLVSKTFDVIAPDDEIYGSTASITVTVLPHSTYGVDQDSNSVEVTVEDDESVPEISISAITNSVTEGNPLWFLVSANRMSTSDISIQVDVDDGSSEFVDDSTKPEEVLLSAFSSLAYLQIETVGNDEVEPDASITVTIGSSEEYAIVDELGVASATVKNDDEPGPVLTTSAVVEEIVEGGIAAFRVTADKLPDSALTVNIRITDSGSFMTGTVPETTEISNAYSSAVAVGTEDDELNEPNGTITLEILAGDGYSFSSGQDGRAVVTVFDNDESEPVPEMEIYALSASVVEGNNANFRIYSNELVDEDTTVRVNVATSGDFFSGDTDGIREEVIEEDTGSVQFSIQTLDDDIEEDDGSITVVIETDDSSPTTYNVSSISTATINISDDDGVPTISIASVSTPIEESDTVPAEFTITSTKTLLNDLTIFVDVLESGEVISGVAPKTVILEAGATSVNLEVSLSDDDINEAQNKITAKIKAGVVYNVADAPGNSAYVNVTDNDQFVLRAGMHMDGRRAPWDEYSGALPIEGLPMILYFNHEGPPEIESNRDITVNFQATDTQGKLISPLPTSAVIMEGKARSGEVLLYTSCNEANEPSSTITVTVLAGDGYVSQGDGTFTATLNDQYIGSEGLNTCPGPRVISISADKSEVNEGESFNLTISPDGHNNETYHVSVDVSHKIGDFVSNPTRHVIEFKDGSKQNKYLPITAPDNDTVDQETGVINASIVDTDDSIAGTVGTVRVNVLDNDSGAESSGSLPTVSISAVSDEISEGDPAVFIIGMNGTFDSAIAVNVSWTEEGNFLSAGSDSLKFEKDDTEKRLELPTAENPTPNTDGSVTATLDIGTGYQVLSTKKSKKIVILDDDAAPSPERSQALHQSVLPFIVGTSSEQAVDTVTSRAKFAFSNSRQARFELNGAISVEEMVKLSGKMMNEEEMDWKRFLSGSSFALPLFPESDGISATVWGTGINGEVSDIGTDDSLVWDGDSFSGFLGFDAQFGRNLLIGVAASENKSIVDFKHRDYEGELKGKYKVSMSNLHPYMAWTNNDQSRRINASFGYGYGEVEIDYEYYDSEAADSSLLSASIGGSERLYSSESLFGGGLSELSVNAETWFARQSVRGNGEGIVGATVDTKSMRYFAEGSHEKTFADGSIFKPTLAFGVRWDDGDGKDGLGIELMNSASYENPFGIGISGMARVLASDSITGGEEGVRGELNYDFDQDSVGIFTSISPAWGVLNESSVRQLWDESAEYSGNQSHADYEGARLDVRFGYGFGILDESATLAPYVSTELFEGGRNNFRIGSTLGMGQDMNIQFIRIHELHSNGSTERTTMLSGSLNW